MSFIKVVLILAVTLCGTHAQGQYGLESIERNIYRPSPSYQKPAQYGSPVNPYFPVVVAGVVSNRNRTRRHDQELHHLRNRVSALETKTMQLMQTDINLLNYVLDPCSTLATGTDTSAYWDYIDSRGGIGRCYYINSETVEIDSQTAAQAACTAVGGVLIEPTTLQELDDLIGFCTQGYFPRVTPGGTPNDPTASLCWTGLQLVGGAAPTTYPSGQAVPQVIQDAVTAAINAIGDEMTTDCVFLVPRLGLSDDTTAVVPTIGQLRFGTCTVQAALVACEASTPTPPNPLTNHGTNGRR